MAAIMQSQQSSDVSAARAFWQSKMQKHPNIAGLLSITQEVAGFFLNGHFIVALARWIIRVSGYVAESALLFAVLWISATSVAPGLVELFMNAKLMQSLVSVALIVLALIPEIILANAIVNAAGHWLTVARDRHNVMAWTWAIAFTLPTLLFLFLTAYTLNTLAANGGNFVQASTGMVGLRCFAGWSYGLLEMVYAGIGRKMVGQAQPAITPAPVQPTPAQQIDYQEIARQLLPTLRDELKQIVPDTTGLVEQLHQLRTTVETLAARNMDESEPLDEPGQENILNLQSYRQVQNNEPLIETESEPKPRITVNLDELENEPVIETKREPKREPTKGNGTAQERALRVLKKYPNASPSELAKRAGITPQYAGRILKQKA
jgi:hypothetical protein